MTKTRIIVTLSFIISVIFGAIFARNITQSNEAITILIGLFSLMSASFFSVASIIGDPSMLFRKNSKTAKDSARTNLIRIQKLYLFCMLCIINIFVGAILMITSKQACNGLCDAAFIYFDYTIELLFSVLTIWLLILMIIISFYLMYIKNDRLKAEIRELENAEKTERRKNLNREKDQY